MTEQELREELRIRKDIILRYYARQICEAIIEEHKEEWGVK